MEVLCTVGIIQHLTGVGKERLDVFPYPRCAISHPTQPHLVFRNHARLFDLRERLPTVLLRLSLRPTQEMHDPVTIKQIQAPALGVTPLSQAALSSGVPARPIPCMTTAS